MQKELQITLTIIGILVIGGVLLHGMWTSRKNAEKLKKARFEPSNWEPTIDNGSEGDNDESVYDDVGVGKARAVISDKDRGTDDIDALSIKQSKEDSHSLLNDPLLDNTSMSDSTDDADAAELSGENHRGFPNYAQYVKNEQALPKNPNLFDEFSLPQDIEKADTLVSGIHDVQNHDEDGLSSDEVQSDQSHQSSNKNDSPVYSNVVTQRKPEFGKPVGDENEDSFGQPPGFLLKNSGSDDKVMAQSSPAPTPRSNVDNQLTPRVKQVHGDVPTNKPNLSDKKPFDSTALPSGEASQVKYKETPASEEPVEKQLSFTQQAKRFVTRNKKTVADKIRKEPLLTGKAAEDQMRMDFDESQSAENKEALVAQRDEAGVRIEAEEKTKPAESKPGDTDVLVLNIRAADENPISGASLLPMLLTLGFKFGEHDIFHRHVNTNGKGPILFSLTNMFKPGVFDIDNIENFSTYGLSLFMMLPIEGEPQQVFNMMHNAARKISDEFGGRILDVNKVGLSKQSLQQYIERIREFERRRISKA